MLRDRAFRRYWFGQTLSSAGSSLSAVALPFAVLSLSRSAAGVGLVMLAGRAPVIAFTVLGGVLGDRHSRRRLMLASDAARTGLQAITAGLLVSGSASVGSLAALQAGAGLAGAMFAPAADGLVANLAPAGRVRECNALLSMSSSAAAVVSLALAGLLVASLGAGYGFALDAASFAASTVSLALLPRAALRRVPAPRSRLLSEAREGWRAVRSRTWLLASVIHVALLNALVLSPFFVLGPVVAARRLGGAPAWAAIAIGYALGALAESAVTLRWEPARPILAAFVSSLVTVPLLVMLADGAPLGWMLPAAAAKGLQGTVYDTFTVSRLQANVPDRLLARCSAFADLGSLAGVPLGMGLAGEAAGAIGVATVLRLAAAWVVLSALVACVVPGAGARLPLHVAHDQRAGHGP